MATRLIAMRCVIQAVMVCAWAGAVSAMPSNFPIPMHRPKDSLPPKDPIMNVVMVHGLFETGYSFRSMRNRLHERGVRCLVARLQPSDARTGIDTLATHLKKQIDAEFGNGARFSMVGFSMGGLVSRYYLQELGGHLRCDRLITIASPHGGSQLAHVLWGKGGRQMEPGSEFLQSLAASERMLGDMPVSSLRTPMDLIVLPSSHSIWPRAENRAYRVVLHPWMLTDHRVIADVERQLLGNLPSSSN